MFQLTSGQDEGLHKIRKWYTESKIQNKIFVLSGRAGTGKTTLVKNILDDIVPPRESVHMMTFTGKASSILAEKIESKDKHAPKNMRFKVSTIHSFMYKPKMKWDANLKINRIDGWEFNNECHVGIDLIIIDESSMIGSDIFTDLMRIPKPKLFIGDNWQLPPIETTRDYKSIFEVQLDHELDEIVRQLKDNPIIELSKHAYERGQLIPTDQKIGESIFSFSYDKGKKYLDRIKFDLKTNQYNILCGLNKTRVDLNKYVRSLNEMGDDMLYSGEKLINIQNTQLAMNGEQFYTVSAFPSSHFNSRFYSTVLMKEDNKNSFKTYFPINLLDQANSDSVQTFLSTFNKSKPKDKRDVANFIDFKNQMTYMQYGYAISVHKAQGSEWERVIFVNEAFGWDFDTRRRWLYTAVTRAKDKLMILNP